MNNDLISRSALIAEFEWLKQNTGAYNHAALDEHIERIKRAPAVDVTPVRHGRWIRTVVSRKGEKHTQYVCSVCNDYHGFRDDPGESAFNGNYIFCRLCGSKNGRG